MSPKTFHDNRFCVEPPPKMQAAERDALIAAHLAKVRLIAERIAAKLPPSIEREDVYCAGVVGLLDAVERFDPRRGILFGTFAETRVRGAIFDSLRQSSWASRAACRRARVVRQTFQQIEREKRCAATEAEVAARLRVSVAAVRRTLDEARNFRHAELDGAPNETGASLRDTLYDCAASPLDECEANQRRKQLAAALNGLPARERQVVALYYVEELTLKQIGAALGVSESRVSQLRSQALGKLRRNLTAADVARTSS